MNRKAVKMTKPPKNDDIELRKLELSENLFALEKSKFEHQKQVDGQRLSYDAKKAPPNLTKWLAIAAIIISGTSPIISGYVQNRSARLAFESKVLELKNQETLTMTGLQSGMTMDLVTNWKALNSIPSDDRRNMVRLIKSFFPSRSYEIFSALERNSPPAAKADWREAKASIVVAQSLTADIASQIDEKAVSPAQETKASDVAKTLGISRSTTPNWMLGAYGTSWPGVANDPLSAFATNPNLVPSIGVANDYPLSGLNTRLTSLIEVGGSNDSYQIGTSPYGSSAGLLTSYKPSTVNDAPIFVTITGEQTASVKTPLYTLTAGPGSVNAITVTGSSVNNATTRPAFSYQLADAGMGRAGLLGITPDSEIGKPFPIVKPSADTMVGTAVTKALYFDANGRLTTESPATSAKASVTGSPLIFSDTPGNVLPVSFSATVKEKTPTAIIEASKPRTP